LSLKKKEEDTVKIMVCMDGSNVAKDALVLAKKRAKALDAEIYLLTSMVGGSDVPIDEFEKAEKMLKKAKNNVKAEGIPCESLLSVRGLDAGEELVRLAKEEKIDEIYIGIRRRSKVGKFVFGSTAQYVILEAPCPVVTVK
jgi:nucleotide-binding universal stress UspA family protein